MFRRQRAAYCATVAVLALSAVHAAAFDQVFDFPGEDSLIDPETQVIDFGEFQINVREDGLVPNPTAFALIQYGGGGSELNLLGGVTDPAIQFFIERANIESGELGFANALTASCTDENFNTCRGEFRMTGGSIGNAFAFDNFAGAITGGSLGRRGFVVNSDLVLNAGSIATELSLQVFSRLEVRGGEIGPLMSVTDDSTLLVRGGVVGRQVFADGEVIVVGGEMGGSNRIGSQGRATISGGVQGDSWFVELGGELRLRGGSFGDDTRVADGGTLELVGSQFAIDGTPVAGLDAAGSSVVVSERAGTLTGVLLDGTPIDLTLDPLAGLLGDDIAAGATLRLIAGVRGDYNGDGSVDALDRDAWTQQYGNTQLARPGDTADGNGDGIVDAADYTLWRDATSAPSSAVPEPTTATTTLVAAAALAHFFRLRLRRFG